MTPPKSLSPGAEQFAAVVARSSATDVAKRLGCDESAARAWVKGKRTPSHLWRVRIADAFGIAADTWDAPASGSDDAPPARPPARLGGSQAPRSASEFRSLRTDELLEDVVSRFLALDAEARDPSSLASVRDRAGTLAGLTNAIKALSRQRGDDAMTLAKFLKNREWAQIEEAIEELLRASDDAPRDRFRQRMAALEAERKGR